MTRAPVEQWPDRLEQTVVACALFHSVDVLQETASTQDAARRAGARGGEILTAWRQTAGRGRRGRSWADTGEDGVATTFVVNRRRVVFDERLAIASAIGTARAIESVADIEVGIKWPNDIVTGHQKIAGVLIEIEGDTALIGVGINVSQADWPAELAGHAVSLRQLGVDVDRLDVVAALAREIDVALHMETVAIIDAFVERDVLAGTEQTFRQGDRIIRGRVERIDPLLGLVVRGDDGREQWLRAATTTMQVEDASGR